MPRVYKHRYLNYVIVFPTICACGCKQPIQPGYTFTGAIRRYLPNHAVRHTNHLRGKPGGSGGRSSGRGGGKSTHPSVRRRAFVYLLHFEPAYKHARHYAGVTVETVAERLERHVIGQGSPLVKVAYDAGCTITIARVWKFPTRAEAHDKERRIKLRSSTRNCPICQRAIKAARAEERRADDEYFRSGTRYPGQ